MRGGNSGRYWLPLVAFFLSFSLKTLKVVLGDKEPADARLVTVYGCNPLTGLPIPEMKGLRLNGLPCAVQARCTEGQAGNDLNRICTPTELTKKRPGVTPRLRNNFGTRSAQQKGKPRNTMEQK